MSDILSTPRIGYIVKMFPRLSETFILNEILELERQGAEVVIFSIKKPNEGKFHPQLSQLRAEVFYLEDLDPKKWPLWVSSEWNQLAGKKEHIWKLLDHVLSRGELKSVEYVWWSAWVASMAQKLQLNHLHAHFASLPSTIAYFAGTISELPYSFTAHAKDIFVYDIDEHYLREKLQTARFVVTVTRFNKRYLAEKTSKADVSRVRVIHNGIDLRRFMPDGAFTRVKNLILAVGRLVVKKGFDDLLEACGMLRKNGIAFHCLIVGDGPERENLFAQRQRLQLENEVTLDGARHVDEVRLLMQKAAIFCLPCTIADDNNQDALPTVLLEALACGLPIVSTTISGIPEIVDHEVNGLLVEHDKPRILADAMSKLLGSQELRSRFVAKGLEKAADKFDLRKNVGTLLAAFRESIAPVKRTFNKEKQQKVAKIAGVDE